MVDEGTRTCGNCGYDLQGLEESSHCPECGTDPHELPPNTNESLIAQGLMGVIESNIAVMGLDAMPDVRRRVRQWMLLGGCTVVGVGVLQFAVMFTLIPIGLYRFTLACISIVWPFMVVGMLPASADKSMPPMYRLVRPYIPMTQWCWISGYALWIVIHIMPGNGTLDGNLANFWPLLLLHLIGGIGIAGLAVWLHDFSGRMNLTEIAKQLNIVAWAFVTWGFFVFVFPWKQISAANPTAEQGGLMWWAVIFALMGPWFWVLFIFAKALFSIALHAQWDIHYEKSRVGRLERIREKREALEKERGEHR